VTALAQLHLLTNDVGTQSYSMTMTPQGTGGFVRGTVSCPPGTAATGGGVLWNSGFTMNNFILYSGPYVNGWQAGADAGGASGLPQVQVMCADLD
jgi:hypothetical protein